MVSRSKWNNTLLVRYKQPACQTAVVAAFVKSVRKVWTSPDSVSAVSSRMKYHTEFNHPRDTVAQNYYGVTREQVEMIGGVRMHNHVSSSASA